MKRREKRHETRIHRRQRRHNGTSHPRALAERTDIELIALPEAFRKDENARREALSSADIAFLCLPDDAARDAVGMIQNPDTVVIDTSTAHRTAPDFAYGFPELSPEFEEKIKKSKRIAVPGCHASGFIALVYPLIKAAYCQRRRVSPAIPSPAIAAAAKNDRGL